MENFRTDVKSYFSAYEKRFKAVVIDHFKEDQTISDFYNECSKPYSWFCRAKEMIEEMLPMNIILEESKYLNLKDIANIKQPTLKFLNKYCNNFVQKYVEVEKSYNNSLESLHSELLNKTSYLVYDKHISAEDLKIKVNNMECIEVDFLIEFYNFEKKVLSKKLAVSAYKMINPIHELMETKETEKENLTYIDILLEKFSLYDLPDDLTKFFNTLKEYNLLINKAHSEFRQKEIKNKGILYFGNRTSGISIDDIKKLFDDLFFFDSNILKKGEDKLILFNDSCCEINKLFAKFLDQYNLLKDEKNKINFDDHLLENGDINKNKIELSESYKTYLLKILLYTNELELGLRKELRNLLKAIGNIEINNNLPQVQQIRINNTKNNEYILKVKEESLEFLKELIPNKHLTILFNKYKKIIQSGQQEDLNTEMKHLQNKLRSKINYERKEQIIYQIEKYLIDDVVKLDFLNSFSVLINSINEIYASQVTEIANLQKKKTVEHINLLLNDITNTFKAEQKYITTMDNWAKEKIKTYSISSFTNNNGNNGGNDGSEEKSGNGGNDNNGTNGRISENSINCGNFGNDNFGDNGGNGGNGDNNGGNFNNNGSNDNTNGSNDNTNGVNDNNSGVNGGNSGNGGDGGNGENDNDKGGKGISGGNDNENGENGENDSSDGENDSSDGGNDSTNGDNDNNSGENDNNSGENDSSDGDGGDGGDGDNDGNGENDNEKGGKGNSGGNDNENGGNGENCNNSGGNDNNSGENYTGSSKEEKKISPIEKNNLNWKLIIFVGIAIISVLGLISLIIFKFQ